MSGDFYDLLPSDVKKRCRHIDRIEFKGSSSYTDIYTFDINHLEDVGELVVIDPKNTKIDYDVDECINAIQNGISEDYLKQYNNAIDLYIKGQWLKAKEIFERINNYRPNDGAVKIVMNYMQENNFDPGNNWCGCRKLD